ncbi:protein sidekick-2-like isoform X2 [Acropora muricata]|uniref:protein sidekick-2-like isoform X2 n=1 Tax=Acropora muricata TaxID=159855 RepID=UPI0034E3E755
MRTVRPSASPAYFRGNRVSSTSIFVQWDQVPPQYQNGVILYYTVTYYRVHYSLFPQTVFVAAPTTQVTLTGLNQDTLYSISLSASTRKGGGPSTSIYIVTGCTHVLFNGTNGEITFHSYFYYYYRYSGTCSWKIMVNKGEQVKLVLKSVELYYCGISCSCGHLEIQNGTYADGSTTTRMCSSLLGNVTIYSQVGHGLKIQAVHFAYWWDFFRASYTVIRHKDTVSDECSNYTFLNESNRATTYADRRLGNLSDSKLSGWYRFSGGAGTQMAEACPKMYSCSTNSSGWLRGTHPTVAEGIVQRKVCFSQRVSQFFYDCCNHSKNISVRNCGAFYVYRLDPLDSYSRYCGNGLSQVPECSTYQFLTDCHRAVTYRSVVANCNDTNKLLGWYRFGGEAGTQMADSCVSMRHCGARYPGWLSGGHPSVSDGAVLRKVCFTGYRGCCQYSTFISVRNCSGFYVYKLSPVYPTYYSCNFRYCSSNGFEVPPTSTTGSSASPANVSGYNISSTRIFVQWDQVPAPHQNIALLYYTVTYRALPSGFRQTVIVAAPAHQTTLTGLNKYTNYSITVFASTCKAGNVSAPIFIVTDEDTPSASPANVRGNSTSTSIFVQWEQVPSPYQNGVILYYTVTYYRRYYSHFPQRVIVAAPTTQTTLTGLNQSTVYSISVSASTSKGDGPATYIDITTGCAEEQEIRNRTNGEIIFYGYYYHYYYNRYINQTCSWKIMANKGEQVKLVIEYMYVNTWCGWSCSCNHLEIKNGTYADGSTTTRMCSYLLGNVPIYSHVGHGLKIQAVHLAFWWAYMNFRASYTVISHKDTVSNECSNYIFLNESNRAMAYADRSLGNLSDSKLSGWYRFSGGAGAQMADSCPRMYSCSTNSSGWLNGTHPTVAEGIVQRNVCFSKRVSQFFNDCCNRSKNISVRNCGAFYVYRLDPSDHYSRYCGNGLPQAPECLNYKFLNDSSRAVTYKQSVLWNCDDTTKLLGWYRFGGEAGTQMADNCVKQRHCGARYPGWLSGGHPSLSDGAVLRKVCFTRYSGCCHYSTFISVRNCSGFYVYKLSPAHPYYYCNFRYCSSNGFELPTPSTTVSAAASTTLTTTVSSTTGPQRPIAPPTNVSGYNTSSTSVFVQWDQVPAAILYYTVTYRALPSGSVQTKNVTAPANQTNLTGLNKYTNYSILVFASTWKGAGNISEPICIVTDEDTPSASPANVTGNSTSSTSILVKWDQVPLPYQNGVILYYTVIYRLYYNGLFSQTVVVAAPKNQTTLTGLNQSTLYLIAVSASTRKGGGPFTYIYVATEKNSTTAITKKTTEPTTCKSIDRSLFLNVFPVCIFVITYRYTATRKTSV